MGWRRSEVRRRRYQPKRVRVKASDRSDPWIVYLTVLLVLAGLVFVLDTTYFFSQQQYGNSYRMVTKHMISVVMGVVLMLSLSRCRSDQMERAAGLVLPLCAAALLLPLAPGVGVCTKGACRWINLGFINVQPGEFVKVAFILYAAAALTRKSDRVRDWRYGMGPTLLVMGMLGGLLLLEPDFGTAVLIGGCGALLMFLAGVPLVQVGMLGIGMAAAGGLLVLLEPYRVQRLFGFMDPWGQAQGAGYQLAQSFRAFGSGRLLGVGIGASRQKAGWLPEAHTDFVFSVIGEETGLVGTTLVVLCFCVLAYRGFRIAHRHPEMFGQMLAAGVTLLIFGQAVINMCVVLGLVPTKGMALPFLSYGGSSMIVMLACIGILMSLSRELRER